jgi:hypothetical protein
MDRNDRARLMYRAEAYERRTKRRGLPAGALGLTGIAVLRCIAFRFWNAGRRAAWPSYDALQRATGFCRQTIANAIKRLEASGIMLVTRRAGWIGGRLRREANVYRLPAAPALPLPDDESLRRERQPKSLSSPDAAPLLAAALASYEARMKARGLARGKPSA